MFVDLLCTWRAKFYTNISLKVKSRVIKTSNYETYDRTLKTNVRKPLTYDSGFQTQVRSSNMGL